MARYDLFESFISKLALPRGLRGLQREAYHHKLGCSRKGGGRAKNIDIRKISKQKKYTWNKVNIYICITFHQTKKVSPRKVTSPLLLNKMITTSITKQPRNARITSNYKIAEEGLFHINYKIAEEGSDYN